nr:hypothetical protein [Chloroflexota bacterium]
PYDGGKLVQRWFWYSLNDDLWRFGGSLYDPATKQSTVVGDAFAAYVTGLPLGADPQLVEAAVVGRRPQLGRLVAQALLVNDGNTSAPGPFTLRWLDGAGNPLAPPVVLGGPLPGCGAARIITTLLPLPPGTGGAVFAQLQTAGGPAQLRSAGVWKSSAERQP